MRKARFVFCFCILLIFLFSSGCAERPFLSKESHYQVVVITNEEEINTWPIEFTWNSNSAVLQQLFLEASLVLGDLQTIHPNEAQISLQPNETTNRLQSIETPNSPQSEMLTEEELNNYPTILLEAFFTETKSFELVIDGKKEAIELSSVQIEIQGKHPGLVILNHESKYQGIINPSLESAFENYLAMVEKENN
ncbi:MAG: hypothetical protein GX958_02275 [Desulfitobacterium sp.]|nr:hypothetical protein [Desulfitobacterium sp.]